VHRDLQHPWHGRHRPAGFAGAHRGRDLELDADIVALAAVSLRGSFAPNALPVLRNMTGMDAIAGPTPDRPERHYGNT